MFLMIFILCVCVCVCVCVLFASQLRYNFLLRSFPVTPSLGAICPSPYVLMGS